MACACTNDGFVACSFQVIVGGLCPACPACHWCLSPWHCGARCLRSCFILPGPLVVRHLRLFRAGRCFLFGFSFVWGWLRFWASVGPFASLVCLRGLLLLLPRLPFTCALPTWGQLTSPQSSTPTVAAYVDIPLCWGGSLHHHGCKKCNVSHGRVLSRRHPRGQSFGRL